MCVDNYVFIKSTLGMKLSMFSRSRIFFHVFFSIFPCIYVLCNGSGGRGSIVVRAHASRAEGLRFESDSMP